ncbi:unnamed protein product [Coffea canephora]|uniref:Uncharacterized protein n=1 Tax=Coffea canephora TaxID=49390 RepID=A0A068UDL2_COFCA|nr:unnamed protein product [Coffea canephora]
MATGSKLSCLSWNKYTKNHIPSSDYEGMVTYCISKILVCLIQSIMKYEEHEKWAWSVDFSRTEPSTLASVIRSSIHTFETRSTFAQGSSEVVQRLGCGT